MASTARHRFCSPTPGPLFPNGLWSAVHGPAFCFRAWGQYSVDWPTIDGGGGTSTGGVYTVSSTIGQPDAGQMTGGNYTLQGGFWGLIAAIQTPGAPLLTITHTTTNTVIVSWPSTATGFNLQTNTTLATPSGSAARATTRIGSPAWEEPDGG